MKQEWKGALRFGAVLFVLYLAVHYWEKLAALTALVLDAPVFLVCLSMQAENLCKFPLGLVRFHSRRWINDITREGAQE